MTFKNIDVYTLIKPEILKLRNIGVDTANLDCRLLLAKSLDIYKQFTITKIFIFLKVDEKFKI